MKEKIVLTNEALTLPKTRQAMWSMLEKKHLYKKNENFSTLCSGGQSRSRTANEMQGVNAPTTRLTEFIINWMDDNLDGLVPLTIKYPRNQVERWQMNKQTKPNEKQLSSKGENGLKVIWGPSHERETHWPRFETNPNLHLEASVWLHKWQEAPEGGRYDCLSAYSADRHDCQWSKRAERGSQEFFFFFF